MPKSVQHKPNLQWIATDKVTADLANVQSRAAMSKEDEKEFSEAMAANGWGPFPPIIVFFDGKKYWLADGFHRYFAAKRANLESVFCDVYEGVKRDAVIYSAGANIKFSIKRTAADKRRAVEMILSDPEGRSWLSNRIAAHCGVGITFVRSIRAVLEIPSPDKSTTKTGRRYTKRSESPQYRVYVDRSGFRRAETNIDGRTIYLGRAGDEAKQKYEEIIRERIPRKPQEKSLKTSDFKQFIAARGIPSSSGNAVLNGLGLSLLEGRGYFVTTYHASRTLSEALGDILLAKRGLDYGGRIYVVGYPGRQQAGILIDKIRDIDGGIKFMTPEEFVDDIKNRESESKNG